MLRKKNPKAAKEKNNLNSSYTRKYYFSKEEQGICQVAVGMMIGWY